MFFALGDELPLFTIDVVLTWTRLHGARFEAELRRHYIIKQDEMIFLHNPAALFVLNPPALTIYAVRGSGEIYLECFDGP